MGKEYIVDFEPLGRRARVERGTTLLEAARQAGVGLNAICGGGGTCGTCRVRIVSGDVSASTDRENSFVADGFRLACQVRVMGDVRVDVPPDSITAPQRVQVEGHGQSVVLDPMIRTYDVTLNPPSLTDLRADVTRLQDAIREQAQLEDEVACDCDVLRNVPIVLREQDWCVRVILRGLDIVSVLPVDKAPLGLAVDIGTTKLAAYLVDLESGETLAAMGAMNPQIAYGEDVMARIAYAMEGQDQVLELQRVFLDGLHGLVDGMCAQTGVARADVVETVLVGNTCMHHLALGLPVTSLGLAPYVPVFADQCDLSARSLGLELGPGAGVHFLPNIAGFVGADHVAMILATGIHEAEQITIGLDIGTNTEIVLAAHGRLWSCSCASGPAFEGAHIRDGMRAAPGAIEHIRVADTQVEYQTIDDAPPVGICGSGILDAVAEMLRTGVLQTSGALVQVSHPRVRGSGRPAEFLLVSAGERGAPRDLAITRKDINEIQLAKAAIYAGVEVLLHDAGLEMEQVERVVVAGAFGTYLDVGSAIAIGMFPPLPRERFVQVGNAAGMGARMALMSRRCRAVARDIARRVEYVELTAHPRFVPLYTAALMLPDPPR